MNSSNFSTTSGLLGRKDMIKNQESLTKALVTTQKSAHVNGFASDKANPDLFAGLSVQLDVLTAGETDGCALLCADI